MKAQLLHALAGAFGVAMGGLILCLQRPVLRREAVGMACAVVVTLGAFIIVYTWG